MKIKSGGVISDINEISKLNVTCKDTRLVYILNGRIKTGEREAFSGESFFIRKNQTFECESDSGLICAWFGFEGEKDGFSFEKSFACADIEKAEKLVSLLCADGTWQSVNEEYDKSAANMLLALLVCENHDAGSVGNKYVDMAKRYIDENCGEYIKVEDVAEKFGVDRKYLRNLFFKYLGISTKDYLTKVRIEKAKELLSQNSVAVGEIASAVGYTDALAFSKIFKKHVGVSPSDYRNGVADNKFEENAEETPKPQKEDIKYFLL